MAGDETAEAPSAWTWDPFRNSYFYYSAHEQCYVYQGGLRVHPPATAASPDARDSRTPSYSQNHVSTVATASTEDPLLPRVHPIQNIARDLSGALYESLSCPSTQANSAMPIAHTPASAEYAQYTQGTQNFPDESSTARSSRAHSQQAQGIQLDSRFQRRDKDFFKVGKVFKILWPELAGEQNDNCTVITATFNERFLAKIRWFVVIKKHHSSCVCLPIQTYSGRGVAKPGVVKSEHAIMYTGKRPPKPRSHELPVRLGDGTLELGMRDPIRVTPSDRQYRLDPMTRVNFAKVYTVEHYMKVYDFGDVHRDYLHILVHNFQDQWMSTFEHLVEPLDEADEHNDHGEEDE